MASPLHSVLVISYEMLLRSLEQVGIPGVLFSTRPAALGLGLPRLTHDSCWNWLQIQKLEFGLIVCDEGHRLKNSSIKTSSAISGLSCRRRVVLTGGSS